MDLRRAIFNGLITLVNVSNYLDTRWIKMLDYGKGGKN